MAGQNQLTTDVVTAGKAAPGAIGRWLAGVVAVATILCLVQFRAIHWFGDEGVLLGSAQRMMNGERIYADFFMMLVPGGPLLTEGWLHLFGLSFWSARLLAVANMAGITGLIFLTCRHASASVGIAAAVAIGWLVTVDPALALMSVNYHWLSTLFALATAWAALAGTLAPPARWRWPLVAGVAAGTAAMMVQTFGALATLAGLVSFLRGGQSRRLVPVYVGGCALVPGILLAYLIGNGLVRDAFDNVILFALNHYSAIQPVPFGRWWNLATVPQLFIFPVVAVVAVFLWVRDQRVGRHDPMLRPCVAFAVAGFVGCFPRPDIYHIVEASPLACPLLALGVTRIWRTLAPRWRLVVAALALLSVAPALWTQTQATLRVWRAPTLPTPRGDAVFLRGTDTARLLAHIATTPARDRYFFYPYLPLMPFMAARLQVSKLDLLMPEFTTPAQYQESCQAVMALADWVVIDRHWTDPKVFRDIFPAMRNPQPREKRMFEHALEQGFDLVARFGLLEMRHRRDAADQSLCAGIDGEMVGELPR